MNPKKEDMGIVNISKKNNEINYIEEQCNRNNEPNENE